MTIVVSGSLRWRKCARRQYGSQLAIDDRRPVACFYPLLARARQRVPSGLVFVEGENGVCHGSGIIGGHQGFGAPLGRHSFRPDAGRHYWESCGERLADLPLHARAVAQGGDRDPM